MEQPSVPEQVRLLSPLWATWPAEAKQAFGYKWVDIAVRSLLVKAFEKAGSDGVAEVIRTLPPIDGRGPMCFAREQLKIIKLPLPLREPVTTIFTVGALLERLSARFDVEECVFLSLMLSRAVYGDDRVIAEMKRDLGATG